VTTGHGEILRTTQISTFPLLVMLIMFMSKQASYSRVRSLDPLLSIAMIATGREASRQFGVCAGDRRYVIIAGRRVAAYNADAAGLTLQI
jgi:hypothetical protein